MEIYTPDWAKLDYKIKLPVQRWTKCIKEGRWGGQVK